MGEGYFKEEIVPVTVRSRKGDIVVDIDERPMETSLEKMGRLRPAFKKDGTVTAGNASGINDGAAAVLLMSSETAAQLNLEPIVKIKAFASGGVDPAYMGLGPVPAIRKVLDATGMSIDDIQLIELNEAFAAQGLAVLRALGVADDDPRVNPNGGAIALGHPLGMSGARLVLTAARELERTGGTRALCTMCIGVGQGIATIIERV
jgi:acetyl-CoA acetyltransferase family protein